MLLSLCSVPDNELIKHFKLGDRRAYTEIFNRYWDKMYLHAYKMLHDDEKAKDVVQEIFISLWVKAAQLEVHTNLSGYLYIATRRGVLNSIRKDKTQTIFYDNLCAYVASNQDSIIEVITAKELANSLDLEIQNLPAKMRQVYEMSRVSYLSHKEISNKLSISPNTVKKQISNAIKHLRLHLEKNHYLLLILISLSKIGYLQ